MRLFLILAALTGLTAAFTNELSEKEPDKAPLIKVKTMAGDSLTPEITKGKIVVVNVWATWCSPCVAEIPALDSLSKDFAGQDVVFVAITDDDSAKVSAFFQQRNISWNYHQVTGQRALATEFASKKVLGFANMTAYPTNMIIDRNGNIAYCIKGSRKDMKLTLSTNLKRLLAAKN
jgi:thiol-disulfide isomerase/thioredoxin